MILSWLDSVFHLCWILLPVLNLEPFAIGKSLQAVAKASLVRLLGVPRLPLPQFVLRAALA